MVYVVKMETCPECGSVIKETGSEVFCPKCGLVLRERFE